MTIAGDMVASLSKFDLPSEMRSKIIADVIETMSDPNFAIRFACSDDKAELDYDRALLAWWAMIRLLRETQT